jgi:methionyl-tRNA formyltransferase
LVETLSGDPKPEPQNNAEATLAPILKKDDGLIDWTWTADKIFNRARGFLPWPGAYTNFRGQLFHIWKCRTAQVQGNRPGGLFYSGRQLYVGCGDTTALELLEVQLEGRKRVMASDFLNGVHLSDNEVFGARN